MGTRQEVPSSRKNALAVVFSSNLLSQNPLMYMALTSTSTARSLISCGFRRFLIRFSVFLATQALTCRTASAMFSRNGTRATRSAPTAF